MAAASAFVGKVLGVSSHHNESVSANVLGLGSMEQVNTIICALWSFGQLVPSGLGDAFIESFQDFFMLPALDTDMLKARAVPRPPPPPPPPPPCTESPGAVAAAAPSQEQGVEPESLMPSAATASSPAASDLSSLDLLPMNVQKPVLLCMNPGTDARDERSMGLLGCALCILEDRFVDAQHPAMSTPVLRFLVTSGVVRQFTQATGASAILTVLAASMGTSSSPDEPSYRAAVVRCAHLSPYQRNLLCEGLCTALHAAVASGDESVPFFEQFSFRSA